MRDPGGLHRAAFHSPGPSASIPVVAFGEAHLSAGAFAVSPSSREANVRRSSLQREDLHVSPNSKTMARFWAKVDVRGPDECWPWKASVDGDGYGRFTPGGRGDPQVGAHRFACHVTHGPVPKGMLVRYSCDNPLCCNPAHLTTGTSQDNSNDMVARGRSVRTRGNSKLTPAEVMEIRRSPAPGTTLARRFGVARSTISMLRSGRTWSDVRPGLGTVNGG